MSGNLTTFLENAWANHLLRNTAYTPAATVYCAALTALTNAQAGTVTEVTGGAYARVAITFSAAASGQTSNSGALVFPTATAGWGTVTALGIYDASSAGNLLYWMTMGTSQTVNNGDSFTIQTAQLVVTQGGGMTTYAANNMLNLTLRNVAFTPPVTVFSALLTVVTNGQAGTVTEVSGGSYARQSVAWNAPSGGVTNNTSLITYPTATAGWGNVISYGVYDASTLGNLLLWPTGGLTAAKTVNTGDTPTFAASALQVALV